MIIIITIIIIIIIIYIYIYISDQRTGTPSLGAPDDIHYYTRLYVITHYIRL